MKKQLLMATTALAIGFGAPVAAQDDFAGFSEGILGMLSSQGATVSFDQRNVGADGSVEYVGFRMSAPDGTMTVSADWIKGVPSAITPGQVTFTLSPSATITINNPDTGEHIINISNSGLTLTLDGITSGQSAETLNFLLSANSLGFTSGNPNDTILKALDISFTDLSQSISFSPASEMLSGTFDIASMGIIYDLVLPDGQMASDGTLDGLNFAFQLIANDNKRNALAYLSGATTAFIEIGFGASSAVAKVINPETRIAYTGSSAGGEIKIRAEDGYLSFIENLGAANYSFSEFNINSMPIPPFDFAVEGIKFELSGPTVNHGSFEEAKATIALRGLTVSESLYSMIDPGQAISRDPINMVVDLSANVQPKVDWSDPEAALGSGNPADAVDVQDIRINEVLFTAGGARITAEGSATVDNSMGFPFPTGKVTVTAAGVQALVNGLVSIGLVPQDQAGLAMGMMMAFARPGNAADEFVSDIEFSPEGVTANGVPLPF